MKQRYIKVNRELIPVTEEIYQIVNHWKDKERNRARRDGECGQSDYRYCKGDCKSAEGHTSKVQALLRKYGADKLSRIYPAHYAALIAEVEVF